MAISLFKQRIAFPYLVSLLAASLLSLSLMAAESEQRLPSAITNVTVFLNQAQVTRTAKFSMQPGISQLVFDRVSPFINVNSIQVKTDNNVTLLSVSQRNNFLKHEEKPAFITELEDTLNAVKQQVELLHIRKEALLLEKEVIAANKHIGGQNSGLKVEDLEDALVLFRKRTQEIGEELMKLNNNETKLQLIQGKLQAQLDEFLSNENNAIEIVVTVKALTNVSNARIELSYLVGNASWQPFYDVRVKDTKSPLQLISKAYITQRTGEEWKNVILKLSTSNPNESGTKPELQTNYLRFEELQQPGTYTPKAQKEVMIMRKPLAEKSDMSFSAGAATVQQTEVNIEFNVSSAYTIPSDNNPHQVDLTVTGLEAVYAYAAVPRLDKDAFVTARVSGNDLVNQVSGEANVYFDGTFVGKTYINGTTSDSMLLSLGRDKRIQIQRVKLKDFCSKTLSGSSRKEIQTWEISVRNTRKEPVTLVIEDQVPVSTDKDIEVKLQNAGGAQFDESTGKLTWTLKLDAEQSQSVKFSFEVKYPKDKVLSDY